MPCGAWGAVDGGVAQIFLADRLAGAGIGEIAAPVALAVAVRACSQMLRPIANPTEPAMPAATSRPTGNNRGNEGRDARRSPNDRPSPYQRAPEDLGPAGPLTFDPGRRRVRL